MCQSQRMVGKRFVFYLLLPLLFLPSLSWSADSAAPVKVAILPFTMHTPPDLAYLQDGIREMLASRLAWQGKVQVLDRAQTAQALQGMKSDLALTDAMRIGSSLKADYVLFGSITALGQAISIDAKMAPVTRQGEPIALYAQTKSLDEVIPRINQFAQQVNQKVFSRPVEADTGAAADNEALATRNPEFLIPDSMVANDRISYLNPNFVELTPEGSLRQPGLWRSQTFQGGIMGMDVGDLDGDGQMELVAVMADRVMVTRRQAGGLKTVATFIGDKVDRYMWVSVVDLDRDGRSEIYVTNLKKRNETLPGVSESVLGSRGFTEDLSSFGLSFTGDKLQIICKEAPYFLNAVELPKRGKVLLGQQKGRITEDAFIGEISEMQLRGGSLVPTAPANLPRQCNIFNFAKADINGDHADEYIIIDKSNHLIILSATGDQLWKSDTIFAATTNIFEGKVEDRRYNDVDLYAVPSPIVVTDINKDNIPEVVVNRNTENAARFLPKSMQYFDRGSLVSLSWDQLGLVENWKTREISGMVTSVRLADLNKDGTLEMVATLVLSKDFLKLGDAKSTVFSYDLNVSQAKGAQELPKK